MAEGRTGGFFGRLLAAVGLVWVLWGIISSLGLVDIQFVDDFVEFSPWPGLFLVFVGSLLARNARRRREHSPAEPPPTTPQRPSTPRPHRIPPPPSETRGVARVPEIPEIPPTPQPEAEAVAEAMKDMDQEIAAAVEEMGRRKTSAEMVAEAKERYGRRP